MNNNCSQLRVLLVDDQSLVRTLVAQSLKAMGFRTELITQASDGAAALRLLEVREVDLVICDIEMRPMNGLDLLKALRCGQTLNAPNLPFLFLSAYSDRGNVEEAVKLQADDFIVKPPKPSDVERAIQQVMSRPRPPVYALSYHIAELPIGEVAHRQTGASSTDSPDRVGLVQEVELREVPIGALLAKDLFSTSGHLLLPAGGRITQTQLDALRAHNDRYEVSCIAIVVEDSIEK
jgi:DNA-binding NarL/FixJ family response regulator